MPALPDTHTLYWLVTQAQTLEPDTFVEIADNQAVGTIYASPITAKELSIASKKSAHRNPLIKAVTGWCGVDAQTPPSELHGLRVHPVSATQARPARTQSAAL